MKKTKVIIPALAVLLLSTAASVTGTVAWFSMNNTVTVTGMTVTTKVSSSLLIAETNADANYGSSISQTVNGVLEPASSLDAIGFYWTAGTNVAANGDAKTETYFQYNEDTALENTSAKKENYDNEFVAGYGVTGTVTVDNVCYGYVDYAFYLKATNSDTVNNKDINLTKLALKYNNLAVGANDTSWRVGLIVQDAVANTATSTAPTSANVKSIFTLPGASNFTSNSAVGSSGVATLNYGSSISAYNQAGTVATLAAGASGYFKVTVRLWLEGEDTHCTNDTYATLTNAWSLDLGFEFATDTAAVTNIARYGKVAVGATPVSETAVTATVGESSVSLYQYTTTSGLPVWGDAATVTASTNFYSFTGVTNEAATLIGTQAQLA